MDRLQRPVVDGESLLIGQGLTHRMPPLGVPAFSIHRDRAGHDKAPDLTLQRVNNGLSLLSIVALVVQGTIKLTPCELLSKDLRVLSVSGDVLDILPERGAHIAPAEDGHVVPCRQ